jgi:hypothetical protein
MGNTDALTWRPQEHAVQERKARQRRDLFRMLTRFASQTRTSPTPAMHPQRAEAKSGVEAA